MTTVQQVDEEYREQRAATRLTELLAADWPELVEADRNRNVGMPMELFSVEGYARQAGVSREEYIIAVLRAERERRQAVDSIALNNALLDTQIDEAAAAGLSVLDYVAAKLNSPRFPNILHDDETVVRDVDLSKDFVLKLVRRLEERARSASSTPSEEKEIA